MKIVFLEPLGVPQGYLADAVERAIGASHDVIYCADRSTDEDELVRRADGADAVVLSNFAFKRSVIERLPALKMICVAFTGVDHVDIAYCRERGITVCNCAGYSTSAVADIVFGMAVSLARSIVPCDRRVREGGTKDGLVGYELDGRKFGVVGTGAIGSRVARIASAFGCRVLTWSRTRRDIEGAEAVSLDELLRESDIVSVHVALNDETRGMIGAREIGMMKPSAMLINTARGPVVDSRALADALKAGRIAAAGIDVFDAEPPFDPSSEPILSAPNTICTPHIAFASTQAFEKRAAIVASNLAAWIAGSPQNLIC